MAGRSHNVVAVSMGSLFLAVSCLTVALDAPIRAAGAPGLLDRFGAFSVGVTAAYGVLAAAVYARRPQHPLVRWWLAIAGLSAFSNFAWTFGLLGVWADWPIPGSTWWLWLGGWIWVPVYWLIPTVMFALTPDGRLPSARWNPLMWVVGAAITISAIGWLLLPPSMSDTPEVFPSGYTAPFASWTGAGVLLIVGAALGVVAVAMSVTALVQRYRGAAAFERAQLRWLVLGAAGTIACLALAIALGSDGGWALAVAAAPFPLSIALALSGWRLWEIDVAVRGMIVYSGVLALSVVVFTLTSAALTELLGLGPWSAAVGVVLAVLLAVPLKRRLERVANRVVYGDSDDPRATLSALRNRLDAVAEGEDIVGTSLEALVTSLPLSAASVSIPGARWACGSDDPNEVDATFALTFRGESLGVLSVTALPGARLRTADRATLEGVARQFALVVQMQRLTDDLLRSRARLVATREEERRRLSHDLHDSLGPGLAALGLQAHQARSVLWSDPARAGEILDHISQGTRDAVADVRAIASGLATPEVERLGIVGAIPLLIARFRTDGFNVTLTTNMTEADELPAEIELAAYLVTAEALANSARHAQASTCLVNVCLNGHLEVSVTDDGVGLPPNPTVGVGLASMRARVEACTGRFEVGPGDSGGTRIRALLPIEERA